MKHLEIEDINQRKWNGHEGLNGPPAIALGTAQGRGITPCPSPERALSLVNRLSIRAPRWGLSWFMAPLQGRCPWLLQVGPLGQTARSMPSYEGPHLSL